MYNYIVEVESTMLLRYKISPTAVFQGQTIFDLQILVEEMTKKLKAEEEERNRGDRKGTLMKCLAAIRDILNMMFSTDPGR